MSYGPSYEGFLEMKFDEVAASLASALAANKSMQERMDRMESQHKETISALRRELAEVMPDDH